MEIVLALMFMTMFASFIVGVFTRYVLNAPVSWTIEVCSIAYVWIVFGAAATIVSDRQHIRFDMVLASVGPPTRRVFAIVSEASILIIFLLGLPTTLGYLRYLVGKRTLMLLLPLELVYGCFGIFIVAAIIHAALRLRRLLSRDWSEAL